MMSPHLLRHNSIRFCLHHAEEAREASSNEPILFTVTEPSNDEVMINLQLENCPELMADHIGRSMNVTPQQLQNIMEWLLRGYYLYEDEAGEYALSLFYNQRDQENRYVMYMSYMDATTTGLTHRLCTHGIEEYLVVYVQLSIRQLMRVLARHNIEIEDVMFFSRAQQNDIHLFLNHLDRSFLEVQGALGQMNHRVENIHHRLDMLVPHLNLELSQVINELLNWHGLSMEWIWDVTTFGHNTERFMMNLTKWVEALKSVVAQLKEK